MSTPRKRPPRPAPAPPSAPRKDTRPNLSSQGNELPDEARALIWTLTEEGLSQREVAKELGIAASTVGKTLARDPIALDALRARQREARSAGWKQIETGGLDLTIGWIGIMRKLQKRIAKGSALPTEGEMVALASLPRAMAASRHVAESATKMVQLLTGGATERVDQTGGPEETNAEQLVDMAIESGLVDKLPPAMQEYARAKMEKKK